jgi:hypothetical protein
MTVFDAYCPRCEAVRLYPISRLTRLVNSPLGIEVTVGCWCGESFEVLLGRGPRVNVPA